MNAPKAVLYIRVSTGGQEEHGTSLASQLEACQLKADQIGAKIVAVCKDVQSGGDYLTRAGMQKAIGLIESGEANTMIMFDLKRFSRDIEHGQNIKKRVLNAGGDLVFANLETGDLRSSGGAMIFGVSSVFAEVDRLYRREVTNKGMRKRAQSGNQPCRAMRPYGYDIVNKPLVMAGKYPQEKLGQYVIREDEARWVREIYEKYLSGYSLKKLGDYMTASGVPTVRGGKRWYSQGIREMFLNPVYKGQAVYGRYQRIVDETRTEKGLNKVVKKLRPLAEWEVIPCPAIVDVDKWQAVIDRISEGRAMRSGNPERRYMLSGLLRCPTCHRVMGGRHVGGRGYQSFKTRKAEGRLLPSDFIYRCHASYSSSEKTPCSNAQSYQVARTDRYIIDKILEAANDPSILQKSYQSQLRLVKKSLPASELAQKRARLKELAGQIEITIEAQLRAIKAGVRSDAYEERLGMLENSRGILESEIDTFESQLAKTAGADTGEKSLLVAGMIRDMQDVLLSPEATPGEKHDILTSVVESIVPTGKQTFKIVWRA